jgi:hypothetical protein
VKHKLIDVNLGRHRHILRKEDVKHKVPGRKIMIELETTSLKSYITGGRKTKEETEQEQEL